MKESTLESLPNELLIIVFGHLSPFDLCRAFFDVKNARIIRLLTCIRHSLDVNLMRYNQLRQFLSSSNDDMKKCFSALIDTVVVRDTPACSMLLDYWEKMSNDTESLNVYLPSIKKIFILNADVQRHVFVTRLLKPSIFPNNVLQHLHIVFKQPTDSYSATLHELILCGISIHTVILEVEEGMF